MSQTPDNTKTIVHGAVFDVAQVELRRGGRTFTRQLVVHPGAVVVLPLLDDKTCVLIRNERFTIGQTLWELPAGTMDCADESPAACAGRELFEETGYQAGRIDPLAAFYSTPGFCTELMHTFAAYDLTPGDQRLEATEKITVEALCIEKTMQMIQDNTIRDGKTIATLLYYHTFIRDHN